MSVRTTIDIPDELHAELRRRAAAERTSIRSLVTSAIEIRYRPKPSRKVKGPLVGKKGRPAPGSPDRKKPLVRVTALDTPVAGQVRRLGFMAGQIKVPDDFDQMGQPEIERLFGGGA